MSGKEANVPLKSTTLIGNSSNQSPIKTPNKIKTCEIFPLHLSKQNIVKYTYAINPINADVVNPPKSEPLKGIIAKYKVNELTKSATKYFNFIRITKNTSKYEYFEVFYTLCCYC